MRETAVPSFEEQRIVTDERLRLLSIAAYIRGGITAAFSSFFLIYAVFMLCITLVPNSAWENKRPHAASSSSAATIAGSPAPAAERSAGNAAPPKELFRIMAAMFGFFVLIGWTIGGLTVYAGWCLHKRRHKVFILVLAAFNCIFIPYGTLFGVAAIIVLSSPAAKLAFAPSSAAGEA